MAAIENSALKIGITCYPSVGGSGILASALGQQLAARGHEVHFIAYEKPFRINVESPRIFFHAVDVNDYELFKYPDYTLPLSVKMAEVSQEYGLDILHVHYAVPHATAALLAKAMLPVERQPKIVATLHGTDTTLLGKDPGYGPAIRHALEAADAVTAVSEFLRRETVRLLQVARPIEVIHNFFESNVPTRSRDAVRQELGLRDEVLLVHLSNLRPVKRIDLLLETVARIRSKTTFKLLILAGGDFSPYMDQVLRLGLRDRVIVLSNVFEIEDYVQAADLTLHTSESESFCLSILEGMAFGLPGVSTSVGGIPEVIENGVSGLLVPFGDVEQLAGAARLLIDDPERRAELGRQARVRARSLFSAEAIVPRYVELYRRLRETPR
ncbi:MAG TPA: N-acetyl-alpha-D-glucosaminyl L-malate synthase BshA [Opitutaceae bacterium]|nr:N-acetyl-alpha-D-glucosaminyl L-malate synthase BshA [Opitutaceae bacterium]